MAIKPKGKKVTGTKKADKITWASSKAWKKALTVKAGAGNDVINFKKSKYKNNLYGEAGNDKIYGGKGADKIYGGKGNDIINAGKGSNTLYFSKGDGSDTVVKGGGTDTLVFKTETNISGLKVAYSGNNAVITYNGGSVVLKDYKLGGHSAKYVQVGSTKKAIADYFKPAPTPTPDPTPTPVEDEYNYVRREMMSHELNGTDGKDWIVSDLWNDTINAGAGDDYIELQHNQFTVNTGAGDDKVWVLENGESNKSKFYFNSGDGNDYIRYDNSFSNAGHFIFNNETGIEGLNFTLNEGSGFTIGYNGNADSVAVDMTEEEYQNWSAKGGYKNYYLREEWELRDSNIEFGDNKYRITRDGFALMHNVETGGTLTTTDQNDYIDVKYDGDSDPNPITEIRAGAGDDYISASGTWDENEEHWIGVDIYGGTGNDTITGSANIYFESGDGNDVVLDPGGSTKLIFSDETSINGLNITRDGDDILIAHNSNADSVRLTKGDWDELDYTNIQVGDNSYTLINNKYEAGNESLDLLATDSDDNIRYIMSWDSDNTLNLFGGNDTLRVSKEEGKLGAYININSDETYDNNLILFGYTQESYWDDELGEEVYYDPNIYSTLTVKDYLLNVDTKTIKNSEDETFAMNNELEAVKSAVAGWLSDNGYTSVADAIEQDSTNITTLMGADYFGKFDWVQQQ